MFAPRARNEPRVPMTPTGGPQGSTQELGLHLLNVDMSAHQRGENMAKLIETRHHAITQRHQENMDDELQRIAGSRDLGQFWNRAAAMRTNMMESERRDPRSTKDMMNVVERIRGRYRFVEKDATEPPVPEGGFAGATEPDKYAVFRRRAAPAPGAAPAAHGASPGSVPGEAARGSGAGRSPSGVRGSPKPRGSK